MPKPSKAKSATSSKPNRKAAKSTATKRRAEGSGQTEKASALPLAKVKGGTGKVTKVAKASAAPLAKRASATPLATARGETGNPTNLAKANGRKVKKASGPAQLPADDLPILIFETAADWKSWLDREHKNARGLWLKLTRKGSGIASVDRAEAVDGALCYGWIDGQGRSFDEHYYLIKFTPRGARSVWSKINRVKVQTLIEQGLMKPAGLAEVVRAQRDGRWDAAYDSPRTATVPDDLALALHAHPRARASFAELNAANRYAILWQLQTAKKAETRARRISRFIDMLERGETLH